ncbi:MAG: hypothetical protein GY793_02950 [Proteobacteria bacterium]|nr:hypothetical protein [Pseudomonadota bacterium]
MKRLLIVLVLVMAVACAIKEPPKPFISQLNWDKWDPEHKHCPKSIYDVKWQPKYYLDYLSGLGKLQITPEKMIWEYAGAISYKYFGIKDGIEAYILAEKPKSPDPYRIRHEYVTINVDYSDLYRTPECQIEISFCLLPNNKDHSFSRGAGDCETLTYKYK